MVALPDLDREFDAPPLRATVEGAGTDYPDDSLLRAALGILGMALVAASAGLWIMPSVVADPAMMLVKLLFSTTLFWSGLLCLQAARRLDARPEVAIDRGNGQLRVSHPGHGGRPARLTLHRLDDVAELSLRDGLLNARDRSGQIIVSLEMADRRAERDLRDALSLAV